MQKVVNIVSKVDDNDVNDIVYWLKKSELERLAGLQKMREMYLSLLEEKPVFQKVITFRNRKSDV
ncbi:MAG: hypothetical protein U0V72_05670 [Cytophagales bacterium]